MFRFLRRDPSPDPPADPPLLLEPGPLVDRDLTLVEPSADLTPSYRQGAVTMESAAVDAVPELSWMLDHVPLARQRLDPRRSGCTGVYRFWMRLPDHTVAGTISLRLGRSRELERYLGHVGYNVFPFARGRHLAERATRLLLPLARQEGLDPIWITTNPENVASRRTLERLGAAYVGTVVLPREHPLRTFGDTHKRRYRLSIDP